MAPADPVPLRGPPTYKILKFVVGSFGLGCVLTARSILYPSYDIWD